MKAFVIGLLLLVGVSAAAKFALDTIDMSAQSVHTTHTGNVRL